MDRLADYDYNLPPRLIAQVPKADRASARLLCLDRKSGVISHRVFSEVPQILRPNDLLVLNRTRVSALRLIGHRLSPQVAASGNGGEVEFLLMKQLGDDRYEALTRPAKRLPPSTKVDFGSGLIGEILVDGVHGQKVVHLGPRSLVERLAIAPLPPYIKTPLKDRLRYQTVYHEESSEDGSAAAPTAGLHFTNELLEQIRARATQIAFVDLTVGLDTFRPIQSQFLEEHQMHGERCSLPAETATKIAACEGRIVAVGTTTVRTLETFARLPGSVERRLIPGETASTLFLRPGNPFKLVEAMFTNFHMPRTSMLVMLAAFAGREAILDAYQQAIARNYQFLSFGDSMFLE